jgi:hypothetical protein
MHEVPDGVHEHGSEESAANSNGENLPPIERDTQHIETASCYSHGFLHVFEPYDAKSSRR